MALAYLLDPTNQYQTVAGMNNVAGWFEVFISDTPERADVYVDFAGTRAPERIGIDNDGRAVMIVDSEGVYRVEMHAPNGDLLWTQQPIYTQASGGGFSGVSIVSTDESISIDKTTVGGFTQYDLGRAHDSAEALEWFKSSNENIANGTVYPTYVGGTMVTYPNQGLEVFADRCYHITCTIKVDPDGTGGNYATLSANMMFTDGGEPVTVTRRNYDVDTSVNDPVLCEFSYDFLPSAYGFVYFNIEGVAQYEHVSVDMQVHRVYSGIPYVPGGMATKDWVEDTYQEKLTPGTGITIDSDNVISAEAAQQVQADWAQTDSSAVDYIKNKPDLSQYATTTDLADKVDKVTGATAGDIAVLDANGNLTDTGVSSENLVHDSSYVHTDENFTSAEKTKLSGIEAGAQANVQADWAEADSNSDAYIRNKPTIPSTLSAGNGIDITNNVITAKVDGTTVTINNNGELQSSPAITVDQSYDPTSTNPQSGTAVADALSDYTPTSSLATVATTGDYSDLLNTPTIPAQLTAGTNIDIINNAVSVSMTASSTSASSYREAVNSVSQSADGAVSASVRKVVGSEWTLCQANSSTSNKYLKIAEFACYSGFRYVGSGYTNLVVKCSDADDARIFTVAVGIMQAANGNHNFSAALRSVLDYKRENATQLIKSFYLFSDTPYGNNQTQATLSLWVEFDELSYNAWTFESLLNTAVGGTGSDYNENAWTFANGKRYTESALPTGGWQLNSGAPAIVNVPPVGSGDNGKFLVASYDAGTYTASYAWQTVAIPSIGTITV